MTNAKGTNDKGIKNIQMTNARGYFFPLRLRAFAPLRLNDRPDFRTVLSFNATNFHTSLLGFSHSFVICALVICHFFPSPKLSTLL
jgi:hypothetical protein